MRESAESRSAAVRAVLLRFYPHQYPWGESCALTVRLLLGFTEAVHDSPVMNRISNRTIACAASLNAPRARAVDAHRSIFTVWTFHHIFIYN
eukprot:COSAG02_NODE_8836_length_2426_cov_2.305544_1_plen_92_part_00